MQQLCDELRVHINAEQNLNNVSSTICAMKNCTSSEGKCILNEVASECSKIRTFVNSHVQLYMCKNVNPIKNLNVIDSFLIKLCTFF